MSERSKSSPEPVLIASLAVEEGGVWIYGSFEKGRWSYWQQGNAICLKDDGAEALSERRSQPSSELSKVIPNYWVQMHPLSIHPDYVYWFRISYDAEVSKLRDEIRENQRDCRNPEWQRVFGQSPVSFARDSNFMPLEIMVAAENAWHVYDEVYSSGQISEFDLFEIQRYGFEAVINLALQDSKNFLPGEAELVELMGMAYIHIPVVWEAPTIENLIRFFGVMKNYEGRRVWVHCAMNMRVSAFLYLYRRIVRNEPESAARMPMDKIWKPDTTWQTFIDQAIRQFAGNS